VDRSIFVFLFKIFNAYSNWVIFFVIYLIFPWYLSFKQRLVCPANDMWHVLHVISLITILSCYSDLLSVFGFVSCKVLLLQKSTFRFTCFKKLLIYHFSDYSK
jgi:hypothetical protein